MDFSYLVIGLVCAVARVCVLWVRLDRYEWWVDNKFWLFLWEFVFFTVGWFPISLWGLFRIITGGVCLTSIYDKTDVTDG